MPVRHRLAHTRSIGRLPADTSSRELRCETQPSSVACRGGWPEYPPPTRCFTGTPNDIERGQSPDFVRDSLRLSYLETTEWLDSDWEDVNITIDADQITVSALELTDDD